MNFESPPFLFVLVDGLLAPRLLRGFYRRYADSIGLRGEEVVLDFGCGSGGIAEHLAPRLPRGTLTCVDISPPMLAIAARRLRRRANVRCVLGRIETLSLPADSYDVVVIHNALHDVPESERTFTISALARLLRPGGRLELREPTDPRHGVSVDGWRTLMKSAGLRETHSREGRTFPIGPTFEATFMKDL
ncbi:MAG: class I SAM-dependent methyltransferase [Candidatus Bipolaricaulota bacterium]